MHREDTARLCVTNAKGGTGKTTVAINVAGALNERGHDVLFVDLDPQGNATEGLDLLDAYDAAPPTLFDALTDPDSRARAADLVVSHPEMDVLPANVDLLQAETELTVADLLARVDADANPAAVDTLADLAVNVDPADVGETAVDLLDRTLAAVERERDYDYVVVDSPPFYGQLTDTGLYAAGNVLVPALTEATSERVVEQVAALEEYADVSVDTVGVVANRVENTNEDREMLAWLEQVFPGVPVWEVRKRVALQRAFSAGESLFAYDPAVDMAAVFLEIATELETRLGHPEVTA